MTSELKNNKLIADFMGAVSGCNPNVNQLWLPIWGTVRYDTIEIGRGKILKYHKSWDWLMSVVDKIESLGYTVQIASTTCVIYNNIDYLTSEEYVNVSWLYDNKFDTTYNTVLEFIKKYNNEKD